MRRIVQAVTGCVATAALVIAGAGAAHADTLQPGQDETGKTGLRPNATRVDFPLSDKTTVSVDVGTGNLNVLGSLFELPGVNGTEPITIAYNSRSTSSQHFMPNATSAGWTYGFNGVGGLTVQSNGTTVNYTDGAGAIWPFVKQSNGSYTAPAGFNASLTNLGTNGWELADLGTSQVFSFDNHGQPTKVTDRNGNIYGIDWTSDLTVKSTAGSVDAQTIYTHYDPDAAEYYFYQTVDGYVVRDYTVKKNADGRVSEWRDYDSHSAFAQYNTAGLLSTLVSQNNKYRLDFVYDSSRRVTSVKQVDNDGSGLATSTTRFAYPSSTQTLVAQPTTTQSQSVAAAPHITYTIDGTGLVTKAVDEQGRERSKTYNGNLDTVTSTTGTGTSASTTTNTYGANNGMSRTKSTLQGGASGSAAYANTAAATKYLPSSTSDAAGNQTNYTYNGAGNQMSQQGTASAAEAAVTRNSHGLVVSATLPGNKASSNSTQYGYDSHHQLASITPVTGTSLGVKNFTYDEVGRLETATDGAGHTTTYSYDDEDRVLTTSFSDGTPDVTNTYDGGGNLLTQVSGGGTITNTYDSFNRLKTTSNSAGGGTITYGYDKASRQTSISDSRGTTTQTYDTSGVLTQTTYPKGSSTASTVFVTNNKGQRTDTFLASNAGHTTWSATTHTDYDSSGRPSRIVAKDGPASSATTVMDVTYCYNMGGSGTNCGSTATSDRTKLQWTYNSLTSQTTAFTYDGSGRLTKVDESGGNAGNNTYTYAYNDNGDRTSAVVTGSNPSSQTLTYNAADQITSSGYSYDGAGNLTASPGKTYSYNGAEQMVSATVGSNTFAYTYAGESQTALLSQSGPGTDYKVVYGARDGVGNRSIAQYKVGSVTAYVEQDPLTGQANMLHTSTDAALLYIYDGTGNPVALLTDSGTSAAQTKYDPYGLAVVTQTDGGNGIGQNPYSFKSGITDRATGLVKFGLRWYNVATGSWTQQDTLDAPLDPANANRYAYAGDDPINNLDPTGKVTAKCIFNVAAGAFAAGETGQEIGSIVIRSVAAPETFVFGAGDAIKLSLSITVAVYGLANSVQECKKS